MKLPTEMLHATATIYVSNYLYLGLEFVISLMLLYCWSYSQNEMLLMEAAMCRL